MAAADFTFWSKDASIDFDIRKEFNAKLDGKRAKTFFKTNQRPIPNPSYKNYSRKIELPYENDIRYNKFHNKIDLDNISDFNIHALAPNRTITQNQMDMTLKELAQDYINRTPNMFNGLEPFRSGLKKEPIIGPGHYLRGLLEDKSLRSSTGALVPGVAAVVDPVVDPLPPLPPSPPPYPAPPPGAFTRSLTREIARRSAQRAANMRPVTRSTTAQQLEANTLDQRPLTAAMVRVRQRATDIRERSKPLLPGSITTQGIVNTPKIGNPVISSSTDISPDEGQIKKKADDENLKRINKEFHEGKLKEKLESEQAKASSSTPVDDPKDDDSTPITTMEALIKKLEKYGIPKDKSQVINFASANSKFPILAEIAKISKILKLTNTQYFDSVLETVASKTGKRSVKDITLLQSALQDFKKSLPKPAKSTAKK